METNPLVEIYRSPLVPKPNSVDFFVFFAKMFLLRLTKVDFLKSAHGTTWGAIHGHGHGHGRGHGHGGVILD